MVPRRRMRDWQREAERQPRRATGAAFEIRHVENEEGKIRFARTARGRSDLAHLTQVGAMGVAAAHLCPRPPLFPATQFLARSSTRARSSSRAGEQRTELLDRGEERSQLVGRIDGPVALVGHLGPEPRRNRLEPRDRRTSSRPATRKRRGLATPANRTSPPPGSLDDGSTTSAAGTAEAQFSTRHLTCRRYVPRSGAKRNYAQAAAVRYEGTPRSRPSSWHESADQDGRGCRRRPAPELMGGRAPGDPRSHARRTTGVVDLRP
jgi:hypothetical protein